MEVRPMKLTKLAGIILLVAIAALLASACGSGGASTEAKTAIPSSEITKPKPTVVLVNATTAGVFDNYCAILDISIRNDGADGMVVVVGTITQAGETKKNEIPVYLTQGTTQRVKLVFPLKWRGGDWTPNVTVEVP
jgi:hypothetical protein